MLVVNFSFTSTASHQLVPISLYCIFIATPNFLLALNAPFNKPHNAQPLDQSIAQSA